VIDRLRTFLSNQGELLDAIDNGGSGKTGQEHLINRGIAEELGQTAESPDLPKQQPKEADSSERITLTARAQLKRIGREMNCWSTAERYSRAKPAIR
jgi:hypothetical protein